MGSWRLGWVVFRQMPSANSIGGMIGGCGVSPTGKSFRFVRASVRLRLAEYSPYPPLALTLNFLSSLSWHYRQISFVETPCSQNSFHSTPCIDCCLLVCHSQTLTLMKCAALLFSLSTLCGRGWLFIKSVTLTCMSVLLMPWRPLLFLYRSSPEG